VKAEVVVDGVRFGEGPVWCADGTLVVTSVCDGVLWRIFVDDGRKELVADVGGGANGAAACADGGFLVTQNGGVDFSAFPIWGDEEPPVARHTTPGLQRVAPDGSVSYLADDGFHAPNDLAVAGDGSLFFTDPGHYPPPDPPIGRVMVLRPDGSVEELARDFWFCNGIAFERDGSVVVVERAGLQRVHADGSREWVVERLGRGGSDGFCLDADGRYYACATIEHGVRVVDPDGTIVDFLEIPGDGVTTNCCFGGADGRTLFATDSIPGNVVALEGLPTRGLQLPTWAGSDSGSG
jgi:gluconolactonase